MPGAKYIDDLPAPNGRLMIIWGGLVIWAHPDHEPRAYDENGRVEFNAVLAAFVEDELKRHFP